MLRIGSIICAANALHLTDYKWLNAIQVRRSLEIYGTFLAPLYVYGAHALHSGEMPRSGDPLG